MKENLIKYLYIIKIYFIKKAKWVLTRKEIYEIMFLRTFFNIICLLGYKNKNTLTGIWCYILYYHLIYKIKK